MTLDEAIVHAREVAERNRNQYKNCPSDRTDIRHQTCEECAKEHDQLAEWMEELKQYRAIGTVEELQKAEKEEDILKFYYCDSEDSYLVGLRIGNYYYAHYIDGRWVFDMSRHLPWGEHVVDDTSAWKEHTYPSEPKEINFSEWTNGFIKKECGGTPDECRAAVEKQKEMIAYCDENNCADCPYNRGNMKENRCMNDFIADEIVEGGGVDGG